MRGSNCESVFQIYISAKRSEKRATCTFLTSTCQHFQTHEVTPIVHIFSPHRRKETAKFSKGKKISSGQLTCLGYWWCYCWRNPLAMSRQRLETSWRSSSAGTRYNYDQQSKYQIHKILQKIGNFRSFRDLIWQRDDAFRLDW